jgi:uncharacterized protein (TIGR02147 family)
MCTPNNKLILPWRAVQLFYYNLEPYYVSNYNQMKPVFEYSEYKQFLKDIIQHRGRGSVAKMAEAAGCNRTYLSQCLGSKVQFTPDHIIGVSGYLDLNDDEQEYLLLLLLHERSASKSAQSRIREKMNKIVQANLVLSKKISQKRDSNELTELQKTKYYSSWKYAAVHTLTSLPDHQSPAQIAEKIHLSEAEIASVLRDLREMSLIDLSDRKWVHSGKNIHVSVGSFHTTQNHLNWRLKSIEDTNNKKAVHYTTLFSLSKKDWQEMREKLIAFIEAQRDLIHQSGTEEVYCFCCDLFQPFE